MPDAGDAKGVEDRLPEGVLVLGAEGRCTRANGRMHAMLGLGAGDLAGRHLVSLAAGRYRSMLEVAMRALRRGEPVRATLRLEHVQGPEVPVKLSADPVMEEGAFRGAVCVVTSIEELYQVERRMHRAVQLEGLGTLAGGIAHEFNTLLTSILGYASHLKRSADPGSLDHEHLVRIERAATQGAELTRQLLAFARRGKYRVQPIDVGGLVHELAGLLGHSFPRNVKVTALIEEGLPAVEADPGQIYQALLDLCVNAREAMPEGGTLTFRVTGETVSGDPGQSLMGDLPEGRYVHVTVADTGKGMDEQTRERIFEPFFTTRGTGTGLGLSSVYGIVESHSGRIEVESAPGEGTSFHVHLPATDRPPRKPESTGDEQPAVGSETVLVVDDGEDIRRLVRTILDRLGYVVLEAASGEDAVAAFRDGHPSIDCVILDMVMPGMSGLETARRLREIQPGVRIILSSGFSIEEDAREAFEEGIQGFLPKPFRVHSLAAELRRVLNG
jgi:PAS domain S-box-containing protein